MKRLFLGNTKPKYPHYVAVIHKIRVNYPQLLVRVVFVVVFVVFERVNKITEE
jgi:hypothetical protein